MEGKEVDGGGVVWVEGGMRGEEVELVVGRGVVVWGEGECVEVDLLGGEERINLGIKYRGNSLWVLVWIGGVVGRGRGLWV